MFPKRGALAALLTVVALVAILTYQTPSPSPMADTGALVDAPAESPSLIALVEGPIPGTASLDSAPPFDQATPTSDLSSAQPSSAGGAPSTPPRGGPPAPQPTAGRPAPTATQPPPPAGFTGSITGPVVSLKYGSVQVKAVFSNGRISDVVTVRCTGDRAWACPTLRAEALKARSANIDTVSGATYTSDEYRRSLQAAIDKRP